MQDRGVQRAREHSTQQAQRALGKSLGTSCQKRSGRFSPNCRREGVGARTRVNWQTGLSGPKYSLKLAV